MTPATSTAPRERTEPAPNRASTSSRSSTGAARPSAKRSEATEAVLVVDLRVGAGAPFGVGASNVRTVVEEFGGAVVTALGSRLVGVFPAERIHDAIGAGVTVQRRAAASRSVPVGGSGSARTRGWTAAVSVAVGARPSNEISGDLGFTPVGPGIDVALELSRRAGDSSVLAAEEAVGRVGDNLPAAVAGQRPWMLGEQSLLVGDGDRAFSCREISFDLADGGDPEPSVEALVLRGLGSPAASPKGRARAAGAGASEREQPPAPGRRRAWSSGRVCCWFNDRGRGVISSSTGQEFYVDRRFLVVSGELETDRTVFFVPRDPVARGRNPVAGAVLVEGAQLEARIEHVDERGFGFAQLGDANGTRQLLLLDLTGYDRVGQGDWLLVRVERGDHGPIGRPV